MFPIRILFVHRQFNRPNNFHSLSGQRGVFESRVAKLRYSIMDVFRLCVFPLAECFLPRVFWCPVTARGFRGYAHSTLLRQYEKTTCLFNKIDNNTRRRYTKNVSGSGSIAMDFVMATLYAIGVIAQHPAYSSMHVNAYERANQYFKEKTAR